MCGVRASLAPRVGSAFMRETARQGAAASDGPVVESERLAAASAAWHETLMAVKRSVDEATEAIHLLRATLREMEPLGRSLGEFEKALADIEWPLEGDGAAAEARGSPAEAAAPRLPTPAVSEETVPPSPEEPDAEATRESAPTFSRRGQAPDRLDIPTSADNAPFSYTLTVEEVGSRVKLIPLHQSLSQVEGIRELSLTSYTNGVAVVSLDSEVELEAPALKEALSVGMHKTCRVMSGEGPSFLVRMGGSPASDGQQQDSAK